jgi:hypothetical protein
MTGSVLIPETSWQFDLTAILNLAAFIISIFTSLSGTIVSTYELQ